MREKGEGFGERGSHELRGGSRMTESKLPAGLKLSSASWRLNEREVWREMCSVCRGRVADLRVWGVCIYKVLSINPLVAAFTRGIPSNHLVNRFHHHVYKVIHANRLGDGISPLVNESFTRC